jgi:RNA polymerase sigma-70 factor (ECF subfamily)
VTLDARHFRAEREGFADQLEHFRAGLQLMAAHRLGSTDAAEEAVQETLARAVVALANGQPAESDRFGAFVTGIARHVIIDILRARGRLASLDTVANHQHPQGGPDALDGLVTATERARVRSALNRLGASDRKLLRLCYFEGLTPTELAARLGEPAERVRKRKSRALERLRAAFQGRDSGHDSGTDSTMA